MIMSGSSRSRHEKTCLKVWVPGAVFEPPVPKISSLDPSSAVAGQGGFELVVHGSGFVPGSVVWWDDALVKLETSYISSSQLNAVVPESFLLNPGTVEVYVQDKYGKSNVATFIIVSKPQTKFVFSTMDGVTIPNHQYSVAVPEGYTLLDLILIGPGGAGAVSTSNESNPSTIMSYDFIGAGGGGSSGQNLQTLTPLQLLSGSTVSLSLGSGYDSGTLTQVTYTLADSTTHTIKAFGGASGQGNAGAGSSANGGAGGVSSVLIPPGFSSSINSGGGGGASVRMYDIPSTLSFTTTYMSQGGNTGGGGSSVTINTIPTTSLYGGHAGDGGGGTGFPAQKVTFSREINNTIVSFNSITTVGGGGGGGSSLVSPGGSGGSYNSNPTAGQDGSGGGGGLSFVGNGQVSYVPGGDGYVALVFSP